MGVSTRQLACAKGYNEFDVKFPCVHSPSGSIVTHFANEHLPQKAYDSPDGGNEFILNIKFAIATNFQSTEKKSIVDLQFGWFFAALVRTVRKSSRRPKFCVTSSMESRGCRFALHTLVRTGPRARGR